MLELKGKGLLLCGEYAGKLSLVNLETIEVVTSLKISMGDVN